MDIRIYRTVQLCGVGVRLLVAAVMCWGGVKLVEKNDFGLLLVGLCIGYVQSWLSDKWNGHLLRLWLEESEEEEVGGCYPVLIEYATGKCEVVMTPDRMPKDESYMVLRTNVELSRS